jgi:hypothetical protein
VGTAVVDATTTVLAIATLVMIATAASAVVTVVATVVVTVVVIAVEAIPVVTTGLLVARPLRGAATVLSLLVAHPHPLATTTTAGATTRGRRSNDVCGLATTGY